MTDNKFKSTNFSSIQNIKGKTVVNMFFQPVAGILSDVDMFVINFGTNCEISLHIFSFFRVRQKDKILLTSSDCFFSKNCEGLTFEEKEKARSNCFKETLLESNINGTLEILRDAYVTEISVSEVGDLLIQFSNSVVFEIFIDALYNNFEAYRLIVSKNNKHFEHHIVYVNRMNVCYDFRIEQLEDVDEF